MNFFQTTTKQHTVDNKSVYVRSFMVDDAEWTRHDSASVLFGAIDGIHAISAEEISSMQVSAKRIQAARNMARLWQSKMIGSHVTAGVVLLHDGSSLLAYAIGCYLVNNPKEDGPVVSVRREQHKTQRELSQKVPVHYPKLDVTRSIRTPVPTLGALKSLRIGSRKRHSSVAVNQSASTTMALRYKNGQSVDGHLLSEKTYSKKRRFGSDDDSSYRDESASFTTDDEIVGSLSQNDNDFEYSESDTDAQEEGSQNDGTDDFEYSESDTDAQEGSQNDGTDDFEYSESDTDVQEDSQNDGTDDFEYSESREETDSIRSEKKSVRERVSKRALSAATVVNSKRISRPPQRFGQDRKQFYGPQRPIVDNTALTERNTFAKKRRLRNENFIPPVRHLRI